MKDLLLENKLLAHLTLSDLDHQIISKCSKQPFFEQTIYVQNPLAKQAILSISDLIKAFNKIIENPSRGHKSYNLSSYNTTITAIASSIKTNAKVSDINTNMIWAINL